MSTSRGYPEGPFARADYPVGRANAIADLVAPPTLEAAGLSADLVMQLVLKTLHTSGELTGNELAKRLGVMFGVIEPSLEFLKAQRHCEVVGGAIVGTSAFRYRITLDGRAAAGTFFQQDTYVGAAPVPLVQYRRYMIAQQRAGFAPATPDRVRAAFSHLVLSDKVLDEIGPAVNGGRSIFIYGPPGNGKTAIAESIQTLLTGDIAIPHAIEVEGSIIRVFDAVNHHEQPMEEEEGLQVHVPFDRRWTVCRRPLVKVGGEMTVDSLDLTFDRRLGFYHAPLQLTANGGVLLVDDFGRQRSSPQDLLNRWMVPLESRTDYLTLQTGLKFEVPFFVFVAFATNIEPSQLVDEAFLRRVHYKVFAESPSREDYLRIFERVCMDRDVHFDQELAEHLLDDFYATNAQTPRACDPRDLINQALLLADYRGLPRQLTRDLLDTACASYFVRNTL